MYVMYVWMLALVQSNPLESILMWFHIASTKLSRQLNQRKRTKKQEKVHYPSRASIAISVAVQTSVSSRPPPGLRNFSSETGFIRAFRSRQRPVSEAFYAKTHDDVLI